MRKRNDFWQRLYLFGFVVSIGLGLLDLNARAESAPGDQWAILIGVENYEKVPDLRYTANDVIELADTLTLRTFYEPQRVETIFDGASDAEKKPTKENILREVSDFLRKPKKNDQVLIYFTGHGFRDDEGSLYLAPADCDPDNLAETAVPAQWLREQLAACPANSKFLILDSCHAGNEKGADSDDSVRSDELMDVFRGLAGVATIASSTGDQKSLMWQEKRQSLFSYWLVQALKGHADQDADGLVSFDNTYQYVHGQVSQTAKIRFGREQRPVRIVRSGTLGDPTIARLRPQSLKQVLADMAEQIAWSLEFNRMSSVGVLEFTGMSNKLELLGGDFGLLGSYCAEELNLQLIGHSAGRFGVIDSRRLHEALQKERFSLASLASTKSLESLSDAVGGMPVIVRGTLLNRKSELVNVRAEVVQTGSLSQPMVAGGYAALNESEWAMLGETAVVDSRTPRLDDETGEMLDVEASVIRTLDENSEEADPQLAADFPFQIRIFVGGKERKPVSKENDLYVPLAPGEVYAVYVDYLEKGIDSSKPVFMRLLVDGLNTLPEKLTVKGVETWEWGKRVNLAEARCWVLNPAKSRLWAVKGFYTKTGDGKYREFKVVGARDGLAARQHYTDSIGLITAAFYAAKPKSTDRSIGDVSTDAGEERSEQVNLYSGDQRAGELLGVIHLRYASPDALK